MIKFKMICLTLFLLAALGFGAIGQVSQSIQVTPSILQQSSLFKNLNGQDRKTVFFSLQPLFVTKAKNTCISAGSSNSTLTQRAEVYNLLGNPDEVISPFLVAYRLGTVTQKCRAIFSFDQNNTMISISIENCQ